MMTTGTAEHMALATMLTPSQLKAARSLAEWTREDLAAKSGVFANTIKNFENGISDPKRSTMLKWKRALEQAGIEFLDPTDDGKGEGVRFKSSRGKR